MIGAVRGQKDQQKSLMETLQRLKEQQREGWRKSPASGETQGTETLMAK